MSIRATFHYFQGMECDMYSFYRIPKLLFTSEYFKNLSCEAKVLYGLMLDRMSLSIKNRWFDEEDRAYIFHNHPKIKSCNPHFTTSITATIPIPICGSRTNTTVVIIVDFIVQSVLIPNPMLKTSVTTEIPAIR